MSVRLSCLESKEDAVSRVQFLVYLLSENSSPLVLKPPRPCSSTPSHPPLSHPRPNNQPPASCQDHTRGGGAAGGTFFFLTPQHLHLEHKQSASTFPRCLTALSNHQETSTGTVAHASRPRPSHGLSIYASMPRFKIGCVS